jgi:hypothetical protein
MGIQLSTQMFDKKVHIHSILHVCDKKIEKDTVYWASTTPIRPPLSPLDRFAQQVSSTAQPASPQFGGGEATAPQQASSKGASRQSRGAPQWRRRTDEAQDQPWAASSPPSSRLPIPFFCSSSSIGDTEKKGERRLLDIAILIDRCLLICDNC